MGISGHSDSGDSFSTVLFPLFRFRLVACSASFLWGNVGCGRLQPNSVAMCRFAVNLYKCTKLFFL